MAGSQKHFDALFAIFTSGTPREIQRASWAVNYCVESYPKLVIKHFSTVVKLLDPHQPDFIKRNCARMLQYTTIPEQWTGHIFDRCFKLTYSAKEPIAVRVFCLQVLFNIAQEIPELQGEVSELCSDLENHESAGIRARVRKILSKIEIKK